jgi:Serine phosphatase RsbU, regulator of sigma subunit
MDDFSRIAEVTVVSPFLSPERYRLKDRVVTIGRAADCSIPIKDRYLSRRHAEILRIGSGWILKDCGSANGTYLNGERVKSSLLLKSGDRIRLGDSELVFRTEHTTDRLVAIGDERVSATIAIPVDEITDQAPQELTGRALARLSILNTLAMQLIEDRPYDQLFGYIVDRVMEQLKPSRAAIALLSEDGKSFISFEIRREDATDTRELTISKTLLSEVVEEKKALAFMDAMVDEKLSRAKSIIMQGIHSVLCAPLLIEQKVVGVLYVDFLFNQRPISEDEVKLVAQIARIAAVKLENARLREESIEKDGMEEELRTAYEIQRRLLPDAPPVVSGYSFAGLNKPCRTVSGDYYDFVVRPDGRIYFVIADVSGKGVTAALLMSGLQSAFKIFTKEDPAPKDLVLKLNESLKENLPASKFVTLFAGRLDPATGVVEYTNAGHNPPILITRSGAVELDETDILLGKFTRADYRNQTLKLERHDVLLLFTDGVVETSEMDDDRPLSANLMEFVAPMHGRGANEITRSVERWVLNDREEWHLSDDVTLVVVARD